jgi:hypothetical protein
MKKYIGTKILEAEPREGTDGREGYKVVYKDGYTSWSPKEAFEEAYVALEDIPTGLSHDYLKSRIVETIFNRVEGTTTIVCNLKLINGFVVTGTSACVDPTVYDEEIGNHIAFEDAFEKIWQLEGYLLKERRHEAGLQ